MRAIVHACLLSLIIAGTGTVNSTAAEPAVTTPAHSGSRHARVVVTFANQPLQSPGPAGSTGRRYSGDGYLLAQSVHQQAKRVAARYSLREVASWPIRSLAVHCVIYEIPDDRSVAAVLAALSKDSTVALAEPLSEFHTLSDSKQTAAPYNDPLYDLQTNLSTLDIATAHERSQGAGTRIALIDTGVDTRHPDLRGRIARTRSFVNTRATSATSFRHGTAMAGLIVAVANNHIGIVGIAPLAQLEVFEACWQLQPDSDDAVCNTFTLAKALAAALDSGIPLINMSIAGPADPLLSALVEMAIKRGVIFVGAAAEPADGFPTGIPGVIAAQGLQRSLRADALRLPANHVLTLRPDGQYDFESGTSVAAAELTGVIALLLSFTDSRLTASSIVSFLEETAGPAGSPAAGSSINVNAALAKLDLEQHHGRMAARHGH
ncbi:MAG: S8 family peptidase [Steroidobacteraceae bacterium]